MHEVLLTVLNETLNEVAEEMRSVHGVIEKRRDEIQRLQQEVKFVEDREKCAIYEDEQAIQRSESLRGYLGRLEEHPRVLSGKMKRLSDAQERTAQTRRVAGGQVASAYHDLRGRQTQLAVDEKYYADLQKQWSEVSEHISHVQRAG